MKLTADDFRRQYAELSDEALLDIDPNDLNETARACYFAELQSRGIETEGDSAFPTGTAPADAKQYVTLGTMESRQDARGLSERLQRQYIPAHVAPDGLSVMVPQAVLSEAREILEGWMPEALYDEAAASASYVRHGMGAVRAVVSGAPDLVPFVQEVFGGVELERVPVGGGVTRVDVAIGDSAIVLETTEGALPDDASTVRVYVPDVDAAFGRALEFGAEEIRPPQDVRDEREAAIRDASGNIWWIAAWQE
jgi:PhnB protein